MFGWSQKEKNAALLDAIRQCKPDRVEKFLRRGANASAPVPSRFNDYPNALFFALSCFELRSLHEPHYYSILRQLVESGVDLSATNKDGDTVMTVRSRNGSRLRIIEAADDTRQPIREDKRTGAGYVATDRMQLLRQVTASGEYAFYAALRDGDLACVKYMMQQNLLRDDYYPENAESPFRAAVWNKSVTRDMLSFIVSKHRPHEYPRLYLMAIAAANVKALRVLTSAYKIAAADVVAQTGEDLALVAAKTGTPDVFNYISAQIGVPLDNPAIAQHIGGIMSQPMLKGYIDACIASGTVPDMPAVMQGMLDSNIAHESANIQGFLGVMSCHKDTAGVFDLNGCDADGVRWLVRVAEKGKTRLFKAMLQAGVDAHAAGYDGVTPIQKVNDIIAGGGAGSQDAHKEIRAMLRDARRNAPQENTQKPSGRSIVKDGQVFTAVSDVAVSVSDGSGIVMVFNFWAGSVTHADRRRPDAPVAVQPMAEVENRQAVEDAHAQLVILGGKPPALEQRSRLDKRRMGGGMS